MTAQASASGAAPARPAAPEQIAAWLRLFVAPGQVTELRALNVVRPGYRGPHTEAGFFDDLDEMAQVAARLTPHASGVYFTMNPLKPGLLNRKVNRVDVAASGELSTDADVLVRRWLLIDCDPVRVRGVSATREEKALALAKARAVHAHLWAERWWPDPVPADSGNGYHLLYPVDLPADDGGLVKRVLQGLAARFDDDTVKIDQAVFNPARITKLYGTLARKGDSTPDRPHRPTRVLEMACEWS
jgi:hypothetical protein